MIENAGSVVSNVQLYIVDDETLENGNHFQGVKIKTLDDQAACLVLSQLHCEVVVGANWSKHPQVVCLNVASLRVAMSDVPVQYSLVMEQRDTDHSSVVVRYFESMLNGDEQEATIPVHVATRTTELQLKDFPVVFQIEMDLQLLRTFLKSCESIKSEEVTIKIEEGDDHDVVSMCSNEKGTMGLSRTFRLPVQRGGPGGFNEEFSTKYLSSFVRSMNRTNVVLEMAPGQPLQLSYNLGPRDSWIRFVLAPKAEPSD